MKKKIIFLLALSIVLVLAVSINSTMAYFTSYVESEGGYTIKIKEVETEIHEDVEGNTKFVTIENIGDCMAFVRVKIFTSAFCDLDKVGVGWYDGRDGYWYYSNVLYPGDSTSELNIGFTMAAGYTGDVNIIVMYEATRAICDNNGKYYADWTAKAEVD